LAETGVSSAKVIGLVDMAAMPTEDAKRYMERKWAIDRQMHRQFCADVRATKIKYYLFFVICLLSYGLLIANVSARGRLIQDPGVAIILAVAGPASFWVGFVCWIRYHELNG